MPEKHTGKSADAAAYRSEHYQRYLGNAPAVLFSTPLVNAVGNECDEIDYRKIDQHRCQMICDKVFHSLFEVSYAAFKYLLILVAADVLGDVRTDTLGVAHLAENSAVRRSDALDSLK